jgi:quercetin dioxygenase-like cupin family protein
VPMRIIRKGEAKAEEVRADQEGNPAAGTSMRVLVPEGPNFVMREFTVKPGGHTPLHRHDFEHEVYVLSGTGRTEGDVEADLGPGDSVYVKSRDLHCFRNKGREDLRFICVIPSSR